jgi:hypothetical protein
MKTIRQLLVAAAAAVLLAAAVDWLTSSPVSAAATPTVKVVNTAAEPVPVAGLVRVRNNDNHPLMVGVPTPVGAYCSDDVRDANGVAECTITSVPEGQILVIEQITCAVSAQHGVPIFAPVLTMASPAVPPSTQLLNLNHWLVPTFNGSVTDGSPQIDYYSLTTQVRMYASGGAPGSAASYPVFVSSQLGPLTAGVGQLYCAISGHLTPQ